MYKNSLLLFTRKSGFIKKYFRSIYSDINVGGTSTQSANTSTDKFSTNGSKEVKAIYSNVFQNLIQKIHFPEDSIKTRLENAIEYNLLNRDYYIIFPIPWAYKILNPTANEEQLQLAIISQCCMELITAVFLMIDDMMDLSESRWNQKCWYLMVSDRGAMKDTKMMEMAAFQLLQNFFSCKPYYANLLNVIKYSINMMLFAQSFDIDTEFLKIGNKPGCVMSRFEDLAERKTYFFYCRNSIYISLYLADYKHQDPYVDIDNILKKMSHLQQAQNDMWDMYGSEECYGKKGNDITQGKLTWLIAKAQQLANPKQLCLLENNYGRKDLQNYRIVQDVYKELGIHEEYRLFKKNCIESINQDIKEIQDERIQKILCLCLDMVQSIDKVILK